MGWGRGDFKGEIIDTITQYYSLTRSRHIMQDLLLMAVIRGEGPLTRLGNRGYPSNLERSGGFVPSLEPLFIKAIFVYIVVSMYVLLTVFSFSLCAEGELLTAEERRGASWSLQYLPCRGNR